MVRESSFYILSTLCICICKHDHNNDISEKNDYLCLFVLVVCAHNEHFHSHYHYHAVCILNNYDIFIIITYVISYCACVACALQLMPVVISDLLRGWREFGGRSNRALWKECHRHTMSNKSDAKYARKEWQNERWKKKYEEESDEEKEREREKECRWMSEKSLQIRMKFLEIRITLLWVIIYLDMQQC